MSLTQQVVSLLLLALPVACIAWTVTHEEVFSEARLYCMDKSKNCKTITQRKFFYLFTCEYCFSHYVVLFFLLITRFTLIYDDWRGFIISGFSLVWIANVYMSLYALIRIDLKSEKLEAKKKEEELKQEINS